MCRHAQEASNRFADTHAKTPRLTSRYYARSIAAGISSQSRVRFRSRRLWRPERRGARLRVGEPAIYFSRLTPCASLCWYSCWYRQQSKIKPYSSSNSYGATLLSARGTKLKTSIITITYTIGLIPDFPENFHDALKTRVKILPSRPFCWHFCWYRGANVSRRISAIPNEKIEQMARKNHGASAKPKQRRRARFRIPEQRYSRSVRDLPSRLTAC
jgi:hypothetical protein